MPGTRPLTEGWRLRGEGLPTRLIEEEQTPGFTLPGAQDLAAFAGLLGISEPDGTGESAPPDEAAGAEGPSPSAPLRLPALLPQDMPGTAELSREIDLRLCGADRALIHFELLTGRGALLLDGSPAASFDHGPLTLDLTPLLGSSRAHTLTLRFDDARPAGVSGPIVLRTASSAVLLDPSVTLDGETAVVRTRIHALKAGCYQLRAVPCPADASLAAAQPPALRETALTLCENEMRETVLSFEMPAAEMPAAPFTPGSPYQPPSVKLWLWREGKQLCDSTALLCGRPGTPPRAFVPLDAQDLRTPPQDLARDLHALGVRGVYAARPAGALARALLGAGIHLRLPPAAEAQAESALTDAARFPNVSREAAPLAPPCADEAERAAASAWSLGGMADHPRPTDPDALPAELLSELAGRRVSLTAAHTQDVLAWLRAVRVRLNAEAAAQGRWDGPLCDPGEWRQPDIAEALRTALAPVHLSALPLYGAWWTLSRFSASLHAVIGSASLPDAVRQSGEPLMAYASLEDEDGNMLASFEGPCPASGGSVGTLCAALPDHACALTLHTRLCCGGAVVEQSTLPVYVGERGLLEAVFSTE